MKKFLIFMIAAMISFFLFAAPIFAFTQENDSEVSITADADDDVYAFGTNVTLTADVDGDLIAAGGRVNIDGDISGDLIAAGGYLNLNGDVGDDARVTGGMINIDGEVNDDLIVVGGQITLGSSVLVGGDLVVSGGTIEVNGEIDGDAVLSGGSINISGKINGNLNIESVGSLTIANGSEITGDVTYNSASKADISDNAIIGGEIKATIIEKTGAAELTKRAPLAFITATYYGSKAISFISLFILGIILICAIPVVFNKFNERIRTTPGRCVGAGAIMLFGTPIGLLVLAVISVILFITVIGAGLGVIALTSNFILTIIYALLIYISTVFLSFFIGRMILYKTSLNMDKYGWKVLAYLIGLVIIVAVYSIPFIGWVFKLAGTLFGFGGLMLVIKDWLTGLGKNK